MRTDIGLIELYSETNCLLDERGRTVALNDGLRSPLGRFSFRRTGVGNSWLFRYDLCHQTVMTMESLCLQEPIRDPLDQPPIFFNDYMRLLDADYSSDAVGSGPFYWFADAIDPTGHAIEIDSSNIDLLRGELEPWTRAVPHYQPFRASIQDGRAVSVCASVRRTKLAHVAGCETDSAYRGRGHASSAVSSWACAVQQQGAVPFYNTDWGNVASQRVAQGLGARLFAWGFDFP